MENIEMLIADLENLISSGKKAPFSANDVVLNRNYALEMVDRIKQSLPEIIKEAQYIKQENERIKADAISYAQKTVQQAEKRAEELLDQNEIIARAQEEAESIRQNALEYKNKVEFEVKIKIDQLLKESEVTITDALMLIRSNREELRNTVQKPQNYSDAAPKNN